MVTIIIALKAMLKAFEMKMYDHTERLLFSDCEIKPIHAADAASAIIIVNILAKIFTSMCIAEITIASRTKHTTGTSIIGNEAKAQSLCPPFRKKNEISRKKTAVTPHSAAITYPIRISAALLFSEQIAYATTLPFTPI